MFVPTSSDAKVKPPVREDIDSAGHFRKQGGIAIAIARDRLADADTLCVACNGCGGRPALKRDFLRRLRNRVKVIDKPGGLETHFVGSLGNARHCFIGFNWILDPRQFHDPALRQGQTKFQRHEQLPRFSEKWKSFLLPDWSNPAQHLQMSS